jgi:hypothetical protein
VLIPQVEFAKNVLMKQLVMAVQKCTQILATGDQIKKTIHFTLALMKMHALDRLTGQILKFMKGIELQDIWETCVRRVRAVTGVTDEINVESVLMMQRILVDLR